MTHRSRLAIASVACWVLAACGSQTTATQSNGIVIGDNVQVSASRPNVRHVEVMLAANPQKARDLIACSILQWRNTNQFSDSSTAAYVSRDGGRTWKPAISDPIGSWDPACAYDGSGRAYFISGLGGHRALLRTQSTLGRWTTTMIPGFADRPWLSVFGTHALYATYTPSTPSHLQELRLSSDGGRSFGGAIGYGQLPRNEALAFTPSAPLVLTNGVYVQALQASHYDMRPNPALMLWSDQKRQLPKPTGTIWIASLTPGSESVKIVRAFDTYGDGGTVPSIAADPGSRFFARRLYLAWADIRSGRMQILVAHSDNEGRQWSTPQAVDGEPFMPTLNGPDDVAPTIAVNSEGVVGITWEDRRDNPDDLGYYVRFSASLDGGVSWLPSVRVSEQPNVVGRYDTSEILPWITRPKSSSDPIEIALWDSPWLTQGHTAGLAADRNGIFHALWVDNRTGVPQMWTAPITVSGTVSRFGNAALNDFIDVTHLVRLRAVDSGFDRENHRAWMKLAIENPTKTTLSGLKLLVTSVTSPIAEAGMPQLNYGVAPASLRPGATSAPQVIFVSLSDMRPEHNDGVSILTIANVSVRVVARKVGK